MNNILEQNRQWDGVSRLAAYEYKRKLFGDLWRDRNLKLMALLTGSRRLGKSVLLKQLIDELTAQGVPGKQCLIYEFKPGDGQEVFRRVFDYYYHEIADTGKQMF